MRRWLSRGLWLLWLAGPVGPAGCDAPPAGAPAGALCADDAECASARCELDRCVVACAAAAECPGALPACVELPRGRACLPVGELRLTRALAGAPGTQRVLVPAHASSVAFLVRAPATATLFEVRGPRGGLVPARYQPSPGASALVLPQSPEAALESGEYAIRAGDADAAGAPTAAPATLEVRYLLGPPPAMPRLHLHLHFGPLEGACWPAGEGTLNAVAAARSPSFRAVLEEMRRIFAQVPITIADISYHDVAAPALLEVPDGARSPAFTALLASGRAPDGDHALDVFFIKSFEPGGVAALSSGVPGPLDSHGTGASGTAVALAPLCGAMEPRDLGRLAAHELCHLLGLFHNEEADGSLDPISDTPDGPQNLMYWAPRSTELTAGQKFVLVRNPLLDAR